MSRKKDNKPKERAEKTVVKDESLVLVRVINNFNDATDNNRFISAGPNTYYRTNKSRADMLVKAGYVEYVEEDISATVVEESNIDDSNTQEDKSKTEDDNQEDTVDLKADDEEIPNE